MASVIVSAKLWKFFVRIHRSERGSTPIPLENEKLAETTTTHTYAIWVILAETMTKAQLWLIGNVRGYGHKAQNLSALLSQLQFSGYI